MKIRASVTGATQAEQDGSKRARLGRDSGPPRPRESSRAIALSVLLDDHRIVRSRTEHGFDVLAVRIHVTDRSRRRWRGEVLLACGLPSPLEFNGLACSPAPPEWCDVESMFRLASAYARDLNTPGWGPRTVAVRSFNGRWTRVAADATK